MHPNAFLRQFWQMELRPQVFVAMKFGGIYDERYQKIFVPAISSIAIDRVALKPYRVDLSQSGDSILTDIMDGIAHARFILADISTIGKDSKTGIAYRSGNVMYEVGIALACRQSHDVLLVRDDVDAFLFDVSTIPHQTIDFTDVPKAVSLLHEELKKRLAQQTFMNDARIRIAIASLSLEELTIIKAWGALMVANPSYTLFGRGDPKTLDLLGATGIPRLLDKGILKIVGTFRTGQPAYSFTQLGVVFLKTALTTLPQFEGTEHRVDDPDHSKNPKS